MNLSLIKRILVWARPHRAALGAAMGLTVLVPGFVVLLRLFGRRMRPVRSALSKPRGQSHALVEGRAMPGNQRPPDGPCPVAP